MLARTRIGLIERVARQMKKENKRKRNRKKGKPGNSLFYRNGNGRGRVKKNAKKRKNASTRWLR